MKYVDERKLEVQCAVEDNTAIVKTQIASAMLADGLEPAFIARYTKLPLRQINRLR